MFSSADDNTNRTDRASKARFAGTPVGLDGKVLKHPVLPRSVALPGVLNEGCLVDFARSSVPSVLPQSTTNTGPSGTAARTQCSM